MTCTEGSVSVTVPFGVVDVPLLTVVDVAGAVGGDGAVGVPVAGGVEPCSDLVAMVSGEVGADVPTPFSATTVTEYTVLEVRPVNVYDSVVDGRSATCTPVRYTL